ncbi:MAG: hypothetical protein IPP33_10380 [Flavobacteriales bacterium]|nr:hypothetical protein [Flavobacteriales bacterium]
MNLAITPRHTRVVESIDTPFGTLVREDYFGYPQTESNLYLVDAKGDPLWFAERARANDAYANHIRFSGEFSVKCASWECFDCEIDLRNGKLIGAVFTK